MTILISEELTILDIIDRLLYVMAEKNISQKKICDALNISGSTFATWKQKHRNPPSEYIYRICEVIGVSANYLLNGDEIQQISQQIKYETPKLHNYRWDFPENTEIDKKYNKVCYALHMLHGSMKANALLSAIELPEDKPTNISSTAIKWLSDKSKTLYLFFDDAENVIKTGKTSPADIEAWAFTKGYYGIEDPKLLREDYPEMKKWDKNYAYLLTLAVEQYIKFDYFAEIFDEFSRFPNEQADLMAYIRRGIDDFVCARERRLKRQNEDKNAQKEETA